MKKIFFNIMFQFVPVLLLAQAGTLDTSFGVNGKSTICFGENVLSNSTVIQQDNKLIAVGYKDPQNGFASRVSSDGSLDNLFGVNGIREFPFGSWFWAVDLTPSGKIVAAGYIPTISGDNDIIVSKIDTNGNYDTNFGNNGIAIVDLGTPHDYAYAVKIQTDEKILIGGSTGSVNGGFSLIRLDSNGNLDPTFGIGGKVMTVFSAGNESRINTMEILPDGKILVGGTRVNGSQNIALAKYNIDGSLDISFGIVGKVETIINPGVSDDLKNIKMLSDGSIIAQGIHNLFGNINDGGNFLLKYLSNGLLDTNFGTNGVVINLGEFSGYGLAIQSDNKIIVSGASAGSFIVARYLENGTYDSSFNGTGKVITSFDVQNNPCFSTSVLIQPDNKIVASGFVSTGTEGCLGLIRINAGTLSTDTFETNTTKLFPNPTTSIVNFDNSIYNYKNVIIYNYLGQEISKHKLNALNNEVIDLSSLSNGVYLLKFVSVSKSSVSKIVKE